MVESWRLNKHLIYDAIPKEKQLHLFIIFTDNKMPVYEIVMEGIIKSIEKLLPLLKNLHSDITDQGL